MRHLLQCRAQRVRAIFAITIALSTPMLAARASDVSCPKEIPAADVNIARMSGVWAVFTPKALPLTGVGFMQAPPSALADLKPETTKETAKQLTVTWKFDGADGEGKWISCDFSGGVITLASKIPENISQCVVTYDKPSKSSYHLRAIDCR